MTRFRLSMVIVGVTIFLVCVALVGHQSAQWRAPLPLQSGVQPADPPLQKQGDLGSMAVLDGVAGCFVPGVALAVECLEGAPRCPFEDGSPTGWPCLWQDPTDGQIYYVDSTEYWD